MNRDRRKVLVLGATGHIGARLVALLAQQGEFEAVGTSSRPGAAPLQLDTCDPAGMAAALAGVDAVVNCVAGDGRSIAEGARVLADAAAAAGCGRIVHLSTMSVYGPAEGELAEDAPLSPALGWYGRAKCEAEAHVTAFARARGGRAVVLRPGCVGGPASRLWVGRIGEWLRARRLGDLGVAGDGWSNLVHVDDVCAAVLAALRLPLASGELRTYNLAAPDSPRWNTYFTDLALAIGATPVPRIRAKQLKADAYLLGPALHLLGKAGRRRGLAARLPAAISPGLLGLWQRHLHMDASAATRELGLAWTPYEATLQSSAAWFLRQQAREPLPPVTPRDGIDAVLPR